MVHGIASMINYESVTSLRRFSHASMEIMELTMFCSICTCIKGWIGRELSHSPRLIHHR